MNKNISNFVIALLLSTSFCFGQSLTSSNLPILKINTNGNAIPDEPKILANIEFIHNGNGRLNNVNDPANVYKGLAGIEQRGSSSRELFPKKPYGLETWADVSGKSLKISPLGLPEESDWVLNASYNDKTFLRDVLTYDLVNKMGRYATRTRYCEVVLNNNYEGLYILMEKIKKDKNRVDISTLKSTDNTGDDVTGGYIIKIDKITGGYSRDWVSPNNTPFGNYNTYYQIEYPKASEITEQQFSYIKNHVTDFEKALLAPDFDSPVAKWREMCDIDTFVDYFLITEFVKNVDGYRLSAYFYKEKNTKGGKIKMGPAWDYNLAFGNADYYDGYKTSGWQYKINDIAIPQGDVFPAPFWWQRLAQDSEFKAKAANRWIALRKTIFKTENINSWIDSAAAPLQDALKRNFSRWPDVMGKYVWPNYYVGSTYQNEVDFLKDWIRTRTSWLDSQFSEFGLTLANEPFQSKETPLKVLKNPIENDSKIEYQVFKKGKVTLSLYDLNGKVVQLLVDEIQSTDTYLLPINADNLSKGTYILDYQLDGIPVERAKLIKQ